MNLSSAKWFHKGKNSQEMKSYKLMAVKNYSLVTIILPQIIAVNQKDCFHGFTSPVSQHQTIGGLFSNESIIL